MRKTLLTVCTVNILKIYYLNLICSDFANSITLNGRKIVYILNSIVIGVIYICLKLYLASLMLKMIP